MLRTVTVAARGPPTYPTFSSILTRTLRSATLRSGARTWYGALAVLLLPSGSGLSATTVPVATPSTATWCRIETW